MASTFGGPPASVESYDETPRAGDVLAGKYRVERILGVGGMGIVLAVEHMELSQQMAIKMMLPGSSQDPQAAARFLREARAAAGLQSEHVVRIFDVGTLDNGAPYMVMELLRGQDLSQILLNFGRLEIKEAVDYVVQACHAIAEAHLKGIVHRDLKPSNLFLTERSDGSALVKVLDFGISKAIAGDGAPLAPNLTATSAIMGSPLYMSPEQVRNARDVDARADIWSLGVILYELLTGGPAFQADTLPGICAAIIADEAPLLQTQREDVSVELGAVVSRCLQKDARKRFQTTRELMTALRPLASSATQAALSAAVPPINATMRSDPHPIVIANRDAPTDPMSSAFYADAPGPSARENRSIPQREPAGSMTASNVSLAAAPRLSSTLASASKRSPVVLSLAGASMVLVGVLATFLATRHPASTATPSEAVSGGVAPAAPGPRRTFLLTVESSPSGADVFEGDVRLGTTPIQLSIDNDAARSDPRKLVARREGFVPYSIVQGPSDENVRLFAPLVPVPPAQATSVSPPKGPLPPRAPAKHLEAKAAAAPVVTQPPAPPPSPPSDIRLQR